MTKIIAKTLKKTCSLVGPAVETCKHLVVRNSFYCDSESQLIEMRLALQAQLDGGACSNGELLPQAESKHYHPNHCSQPEIQSLSPTCVCFCILNPEGSVSQDHNSNTKSQQKKAPPPGKKRRKFKLLSYVAHSGRSNQFSTVFSVTRSLIDNS